MSHCMSLQALHIPAGHCMYCLCACMYWPLHIHVVHCTSVCVHQPFHDHAGHCTFVYIGLCKLGIAHLCVHISMLCIAHVCACISHSVSLLGIACVCVYASAIKCLMKRRLQGGLIAAFQYLKRSYKKDGGGLSAQVDDDRAREWR